MQENMKIALTKGRSPRYVQSKLRAEDLLGAFDMIYIYIYDA